MGTNFAALQPSWVGHSILALTMCNITAVAFCWQWKWQRLLQQREPH